MSLEKKLRFFLFFFYFASPQLLKYKMCKIMGFCNNNIYEINTVYAIYKQK